MDADARGRAGQTLSRAVGVVRVSRVGRRAGESFVSPREQRERIARACETEGYELTDVFEELDVSGGKSLERRPGLSAAVAAIEAGRAEVVVAAYFDRLFRSLTTQAEVIQRVEQAGGRLLTVDVGQVSGETATQWLSGTMHGMVAEFYRRQVAEKAGAAQRDAVARGVVPWPNIPPGYVRSPGGTLEPDPHTAPSVTEAFEMRAAGASLQSVREFLLSRGIKRSFHGVQHLLNQPTYIGEIRFGNLVNESAHPPIVSHDTWDRVQRMTVPRGRRAQSERLLARLGVLRCGTCGARMVVGTQGKPHARAYYFYRCPPVGDCPKRLTVSSTLAEGAVVDAVRKAIADLGGRAVAEENIRSAEEALDAAEERLAQATRVVLTAGLLDESAAVDQLRDLRQARDDAQATVDRLSSAGIGVSVTADDWDMLTITEQRALVTATIESAIVHPGRGAERIVITLR